MLFSRFATLPTLSVTPDVLPVPPTVPSADYSSRPENFHCLADCRRAVCEALGLQEDEVELRWALQT